MLNKIIATASFTIPSPKIREYKRGYSSYLIIDIAARISEEQSKEETRRISMIASSNSFHSPVSVSYLYIYMLFIIPIVTPEKAINVNKVPSTPKSRMYPMFSKNLFLLILKPAANKMGGKHK